MNYDIIVIGAGAAGLIAAKHLSAKGLSVCVLEAAPKAGGRMATIHETGFEQPVETGAEFVHGNLPLTLQLLQEGRIDYEPVEGEMIGVRNGKWKEEEEHDEHWQEFMHRLQTLKEDMTIQQCCDQYFSGPGYAKLREAVRGFAEGFDLADIAKASILSIKDEWMHEDETEYRIKGGYEQLVNYLLDCCYKQKSAVHFNACVSSIEYSLGNIRVTCTDSNSFEAAKLLVTVSAGVLQSGDIKFIPALTRHAVAIQQLGFGAVIKVLLQFKTSFWKSYAGDIGFLLSDERIPTWWTQAPVENGLLTGWLGGPAAVAKASASDADLLQDALQSLSVIFSQTVEELEQQLVRHKIICWHNNPYAKGGYSYNTLHSAEAKKVLAEPVDHTIYFAGEVLDDGDSLGTVEAALRSGLSVAKKIAG